jgi:hypothetical protein
MKFIRNIICCMTIFSSHTALTVTPEEIPASLADKVIQGISSFAPYANIGNRICAIVKKVKGRALPNEEEKAHAHKVGERYALTMAENKFEHCLVKNSRNPARNYAGYPATCEHLANELIMLGGLNEANRMIEIYNSFRK